MHDRARRGRWGGWFPIVMLAACHAAGAGAGPAPQPIGPRLEVLNHSVFVIDVLAIPQDGPARVRLGSVGAYLRGIFTIPPDAVRPDSTLRVEVHALGSDTRWTAPTVRVDSGVFACIDVRADFNGHMAGSTLSTPRAGSSGMDTTAVGTPESSCRDVGSSDDAARAPAR